MVYAASLGALSLGDGNDAACTGIHVHLRMNGAGGRAACLVAPVGSAVPAAGSEARIGLDVGDGLLTVFSGTVRRVAAGINELLVECEDGLATMARLEVEAVWEQVTAGFVIKELLGAASVSPGSVMDGPELRRFHAFRGPRALNHLQRLCALCGADYWVDSQGSVQVRTADDIGSEHRLTYGVDILAIDLRRAPAGVDALTVSGEGAAGSQGAEKAHWLPITLDGVRGESGNGGPRSMQAGALASAEAAQATADGRMLQYAQRPLHGTVDILGAPAMALGDTIAINEVPEHQGALASLVDGCVLRVRGLEHRIDADGGLRTRVEV